MKVFFLAILCIALETEGRSCECPFAKNPCVNIQKLTDKQSFADELEKYDIVMIGRSTCWNTKNTLKQFSRHGHKAKCAYYFYDTQGKEGGWFSEVWRRVRMAGHYGSVSLPYGFHCGKYIGGSKEIGAVKDKIC